VYLDILCALALLPVVDWSSALCHRSCRSTEAVPGNTQYSRRRDGRNDWQWRNTQAYVTSQSRYVTVDSVGGWRRTDRRTAAEDLSSGAVEFRTFLQGGNNDGQQSTAINGAVGEIFVLFFVPC
jgi:hypothetical protein